MSILEALEKHVPEAKELIEGQTAIPLSQRRGADLKREILVAFGISAVFYKEMRRWLKRDSKRRIFFIEERAGALLQLLKEEEAPTLLNDPQVKLYFIHSSQEMEFVAKKVAWQAVFREADLVELVPSERAASFKKCFEACHLAAHLLLSDAADFGIAALSNARKNLAHPYCSALALERRFQGVPALVVGAGPSLQKNGHLLNELKDRALILAGGAALNFLDLAPDFAAAIDSGAPLAKIDPEVPLCFQARMFSDNLLQVKKKLLVPDSHFSFLNWIAGEEREFNGGWTVGNLLTALACLWGCDPIIFVGMDFCYERKKKYPSGKGGEVDLISVRDRRGVAVWTQRDWIQAVRWTEEFAAAHPERTFINATEGGLGFGEPVVERRLSEISLAPRAVPSLEMEAIRAEPRMQLWRESLLRCKERENLEGEVVYDKLLQPLWQLWCPIFEREVEVDSYDLDLEEKLKINKKLFFQQVIEEHLHALS